MKKAIFRNIAIVSAIFILTFSIMLITNYFQVKGATPLQTQVIETLKEINDSNAGNQVLQEQIRQLDLLARRAYFVRMDHLSTGVYILLGMLAVLIVSLRIYFSRDMMVPDKKTDPVDEWLVKSRARTYIIGTTSGLVAVGLVFFLLSTPHMRPSSPADKAAALPVTAQAEDETQSVPQGEVATILTAGAEETAASEKKEAVDKQAPENPPAGKTADMQAEASTAAGKAPAPTQAGHSSAPQTTHNAFRGNNSNGISTARRLPQKWNLNAGTNIVWRSDIPRHGFNSPIINGNKVFITGADSEARELYCYDLINGNRLWTLTATDIAGSPSQIPKTTDDTGLAASSVATNGAQVCAIFATGDIICADMEGNKLWAKNLGVPDNHYGYASSLLIFNNMAIVQYDNLNSPKVIALDLATGAERWSKNRAEKVTWSSPIIATVNNNTQLVLMGNPGITAYNPDNGEQLWRVECMSGEVGASACSSNGIIFGASEYAKLVAINGADGSVIWEGGDYLPEVASPVATADNLYIATSYGVVASYDARSGKLRREHELNTEFYSSPIIAEGKVYLFSNDGKMHIFSADDDFRLIDSFETGEMTFATPAFTDGKIVVRTENSIYCAAIN